jgi:aspartyl-tRNA(Asn)/glutamyl-tRNA(Gln) amidotransferase subunit C
MSIDREAVSKMGRLAQIAFDDAELAELAEDCAQVMAFIHAMDEVSTQGLLPLSHPGDAHQPLRADVVTEPNVRDVMQTLTTHQESGLYTVPQVIETES